MFRCACGPPAVATLAGCRVVRLPSGANMSRPERPFLAGSALVGETALPSAVVAPI